MTRILNDFMVGVTLIAAGIIILILGVIALFVLKLLLALIGVILSALFFVVFILICIWLTGFLYRKIKEARRG